MSAKYHLAGGRVFTFILWGLWAVCHVKFCRDAAFPRETSLTDDHFAELILLVALNIVILAQILLSKHRRSNIPDADLERSRIERRFALVGGFILGVTPLGLTALAFVASHPAFRQNMATENLPIDLQDALRERPRVKVTIGVDVSGSVQRGEGTQQLCHLLSKILQGTEAPETPLPEDVEIELWEIGTTTSFLESGSTGSKKYSQAGNATPETLAKKACERLRSMTTDAKQQRKHTDITEFFSMVSKEVQLPNPQLQHFVVAASDFYQDTEIPRDFEEDLKNLARRLRLLDKEKPGKAEEKWPTQLYLLELKSTLETPSGKYLLPKIRQHLPDQISEFAIHMNNHENQHNLLQHMKGELYPLAWKRLDHRGFLTYVEGNFPQGRGSGVLKDQSAQPLVIKRLFKTGLGANKQPIALRLRGFPDNGTSKDSLELRYKIGSDKESTTRRIGFGEGEPEWVWDDVLADDSLELTLANRFGHSREVRSLELLILAPKLGFKIGVPLTIISVYPPWYKTAIHFMILLFGMSVVVFVLVEYKEMKLRELVPRDVRAKMWTNLGERLERLGGLCKEKGNALASHG